MSALRNPRPHLELVRTPVHRPRRNWRLLGALTAMSGAALGANWGPGLLVVAIGLAAFVVWRVWP